MERGKINCIGSDIPDEINRFISGSDIYDSSSSPDARVYFIDRDNGYYLKLSQKGSLKKEYLMTSYYHSKGLGARVIVYFSYKADWLLTQSIPGTASVHSDYLSDPKYLAETIAVELRKLHEMECFDCQIQDRTDSYISCVEKDYSSGRYDRSISPESFGFSTLKDAYNIVLDGKSLLSDRVLLHGDYCLPNIIMDDWRLSGFVDLGCGGIGDRHIDIFWGLWTPWFNLKTDSFSNRFMDAYGRDKINMDALKVVSACEVFG